MQMIKMEHKGFFARIKEAERLTGDIAHNLPPGRDLPVYYADAFKVYPENWMKGPGVFIVPVKPNKGLWFDWRDNDENNTAVIPTVKGCNPITGLQTTGFFMERYDTKCPKHGCNFQAKRYCPDCGYKWPDRNYVSQSPLWWDGWMCEGSVRQFFFTEEMMRDVATHMIGKENTVPAFGFAFYSPKEPRLRIINKIIHHISYEDADYADTDYVDTVYKSLIPKRSFSYLSKTRGDGSSDIKEAYEYKSKTISGNLNYPVKESEQFCSSPLNNCSLESNNAERGVTFNCMSPTTDEGIDAVPVGGSPTEVREPYNPQKEVSVGAGAKIYQELPRDTYGLDTWKDKPDSVMTIYFVFQEEFDRMASGGFKDFSDCKDGMLKGLPVG